MGDTADADKQAQQTTTTTTGSSGEGGKPAVSTDTKADAWALKEKSYEERIGKLSKQLEAIEKAEQEREQKKLEEEGKYKELLAKKEEAIKAMEQKQAAILRQSELLQAVTAFETEIPKAGLMKLAKWVDHDTGGELPIEEVLQKAVDEATSLSPAGGNGKETRAFGATGAATKGAKGVQAEALQNLIELGIQAKGGNSNAREHYGKARQDYIATHGPIPTSAAMAIANGKPS